MACPKPTELSYLGNYRGKVVDVGDSSQFGRIKVQIQGFFEGVDAEFLPWAIPALPVFSGAGSGHGNLAVPEINSHVWCFFEGGDVYSPVYFAEAPDGIRGQATDLKTNYPDRRGFVTKAGHKFWFDDKIGSEEIKIEHKGGGYIKMLNGSLTIEKGGTTIVISSSGVVTVNAVGAISVTSSGNITMTGAKIDLNP